MSGKVRRGWRLAILGLGPRGPGLTARVCAERIHGDRTRHERGGAARRHGGSGEPRAHRRQQDRCHRCRRHLPHRGLAARHLHCHLHAVRIQDGAIRSRGTAGRLYRHLQRQPGSGGPRGVDHGDRRLAGRGRLQQRESRSAHPRGAGPGADRPQHPGLCAAGERRHPERARRRRFARHAADLHVHARPHLGQQHRDGGRSDGERARWRRGRAAVLQPVHGPGNELSDQRRRRGRLARRRPDGDCRQGRRQPVQRVVLRRLHAGFVAVQQPR